MLKQTKQEPARLEGWVRVVARQLDPKKRYDIEIKEHRNRRSLDANALAWQMIGQLAAATGIPKTDCYRNAIKEIGNNYDTVCAQKKAAEALCKHWEHKGLGWIAEPFESKLAGCVNIHLYYGSSTYDTQQMSRLIDNIMQDCEAVGIETMPPDKVQLIKEEWGK